VNHDDHDHDVPVEPEVATRVRELADTLVEKGLVTREELQRRMDWLVSRSPADGARLVARAWVDPEFKERLLDDALEAANELGLDPGPSAKVVALENTDDVHHMVVCTLCSCYPKALLGPPPDWYKSLPYRSRAVSDPRGVLREFGVELGDAIEVRVVDSTADIRYLVIPRRPAGTEDMSEEELASLVTRGSRIGVAQAREAWPSKPSSAAWTSVGSVCSSYPPSSTTASRGAMPAARRAISRNPSSVTSMLASGSSRCASKPAETTSRSGWKLSTAGTTVWSKACRYSSSPEPADIGMFTVVSACSVGPPEPG
jgi:nitrile hydratase